MSINVLDSFTVVSSISAPSISAGKFYGDGSLLTGITASSFPNNLSIVTSISSPSISATYFYGNGSNITNISNTALSSNLTIASTISAPAISAGKFYGDGSLLTGITAYTLPSNLTVTSSISTPSISANSIFTTSLTIGSTLSTNTFNVLPLTIIASASGSTYNQIQNTYSGVSASTDISLYNNDNTNYVDLGINSTNYNGNLYSPKFNIVGPGDAYLYSTSNDIAIGTTNSGNSNDIIFFTGGALSGTSANGGNERMRITNVGGTYAGNVGINTSNPNQQLTVAGNISATGNLYGNGQYLTGIQSTPVPNFSNISGTVYTLQLTDNGSNIGATNSGGLILSVTPNTVSYPTGFQVNIIQLGGTTAQVYVSGQNVTINSANGYVKTSSQYSAATLIYTGVTTGWVLFGDLST